jgi:leader peptidase (prepilin peptidase)/N-methyltransferase
MKPACRQAGSKKIMLAKIIAFIFGSIMGSFLNVCIHRMPLGESVVWPSSHCPKCKKRIPAYDNIPFISYMLLKGKCRFCKEKISFRYIIVELLTAIMFVALFAHFGLSYDFFFYMILVCALIVATFIDIQHRIIPDEISLGGLIVGFILNIVKNFVEFKQCSFEHPIINPPPALDSFLGILIGGGIIYYTGKLFDWVWFKKLKRPPIQGETESMGGGDVKLLAMIGAFLGWQKAILTFFLAPLLGVVFAIKNLRIKIINISVKKDQDVSYGPSLHIKIFNTVTVVYFKEHLMSYGPFLSLAAILSLFWADKIIGLFFLR